MKKVVHFVGSQIRLKLSKYLPGHLHLQAMQTSKQVRTYKFFGLFAKTEDPDIGIQDDPATPDIHPPLSPGGGAQDPP